MRLFLYILRDYLKYVIGTVVLTVFLFVLFDFIHKTTKYFAEYKPRTEDIIQFYAFQIPTQVAQALPIAGLLASVISMILLSRTNEITAMRAAGMGPLRIGLPLAAGGMLLSLTSLVLGEIVVPRFSQKMHYVQQVQIEGEKDEQIADGARWIRQGQLLVNFHDFDPITQTLTRLKVIDVRPNFRPSNAVEAEFAIFEPLTKKWRLAGIKILRFRRNGTLEDVEDRRSLELELPIEPARLKKDRRKANELSVRDLKELIERGEQSGIDRIPYRVEYHGKFAYPFAAFVVSLIGLKFGYKSERATETAKGVLLAFFIGISYWFVLSAGRALGLRGDIHPFLAAWMPNFVVLSIIGFDAWMNRRG
jgi:lipopolysaccharide export system permease protein